MNFRIVDAPSQRLAGIRHHGSYRDISTSFVSLFPRARSLAPSSTPDAEWVAIYRSDPETTPDEELVSFATVTADEDAPLGDLEEIRIPAGAYAVLEFVGPHSDLASGWRQLGELLVQNSHMVDSERDSYEVYRNQPEGTPPDELRTDLYRPVSPG